MESFFLPFLQLLRNSSQIEFISNLELFHVFIFAQMISVYNMLHYIGITHDVFSEVSCMGKSLESPGGEK